MQITKETLNKMEYFRLEFNEEQQQFHFDDGIHKENTRGWFTIFDSCTPLESKVYFAYVNRIEKKRLSRQYLLKCANEIKAFWQELINQDIQISFWNNTPDIQEY